MLRQIWKFQAESRRHFKALLDSEHQSLLAPENFSGILQTAVRYRAIEASDVTERVGTTTSSFSRWLIGQSTPAYEKRLKVIRWLREHLTLPRSEIKTTLNWAPF